MDIKMKRVLKEYGLIIQSSGKHLKIFRADGMGPTVFIACTPSDSRAWSNSVHYILRLIKKEKML